LNVLEEDYVNALLKKLNISEINPGACTGPDGWIEDKKGKELVSYNPTTGEKIASVVQVSPDVYEEVIGASVDAFKTWRSVPAPKRGEVIRDLGNALREMKEPLGDLISLEMGKIRAEGHGEVQEMIDICDFSVGLSRQLYGLTMHSELKNHRMYEQWHPLGPVGIITAFNFPMAVWSWNTAIAAVCGDPVIWKPSKQVPLAGIAIQHISNQIMADHRLSGIFNLLIGSGRDVGELMLQDSRIPLISFTGSTNIGRHVSETVARRFGSTILELGGNNAIIVDKNADLDMAARAILFGAVGTAGQRCTSTRRIIAQKEIINDLSETLVDAYQKVVIGDPFEEKTLMGPLITEGAISDMQKAMTRAKEDGGQVLTGEEALDIEKGNFVRPSIVRMPQQSEIVAEETFAPILYILEYDTIAEAIDINNAVPQGLSSAIFTDSLKAAEKFLSVGGSDCGIANVNTGTVGAEIGGAFGGEKETGGGRESGSDAWKTYMRRQTNTINWSDEISLAQGIEFSTS
jgi:aldehyde dehydrogenase (NAD+)